MLEVLCVECPTCGRQGSYHVARFFAELGPDYSLIDWLHERTIDCRRRTNRAHASMRGGYAGIGRD